MIIPPDCGCDTMLLAGALLAFTLGLFGGAALGFFEGRRALHNIRKQR